MIFLAGILMYIYSVKTNYKFPFFQATIVFLFMLWTSELLARQNLGTVIIPARRFYLFYSIRNVSRKRIHMEHCNMAKRRSLL